MNQSDLVRSIYLTSFHFLLSDLEINIKYFLLNLLELTDKSRRFFESHNFHSFPTFGLYFARTLDMWHIMTFRNCNKTFMCWEFRIELILVYKLSRFFTFRLRFRKWYRVYTNLVIITLNNYFNLHHMFGQGSVVVTNDLWFIKYTQYAMTENDQDLVVGNPNLGSEEPQ